MKYPILLLFAVMAPPAVAQSGDPVASIRERYADVNRRIELTERGGGDGRSGIYLDELVVNKTSEPWPGSGTYVVTYRFYYDFGLEGQNGPRSIAKVVVSTSAAARRYHAEYLFDQSGALVFSYAKRSDGEMPAERRIYFAAGKPIRTIVDGTTRDRLAAADLEEAKGVVERARRLVAAFEAAHDAPDS